MVEQPAQEQNLRILVTGGGGFAGRYLLQALADRLPSGAEVIVASRFPDASALPPSCRPVELDVTDAGQVAAVVGSCQPTHLVHMAALASVALAQSDQPQTWAVNCIGSLNVALAVKQTCPGCHIIHISTSEVYGASFKTGVAIDEAARLEPVSAYAASKAAADLMMGQMAAQGLSIVRLRPFNHTGPGQTDTYVVPAFARQVACIEAGIQEPVMKVGNLDSQRDFLDVRDVVDGYVRAILRAGELPTGSIYNLASGTPRRVGDILDELLSLSTARIEITKDRNLLRPSDIPVVIGDAGRAGDQLGWSPKWQWSETLMTLLNYWRARVADKLQG
jgi:GDP-4-dehydro-6-deoxy-D-mannose reductase